VRIWGDILPAHINNLVSGCLVHLHQGLVRPVVLSDHLVVHLCMLLEKVVAEVCASHVCLVEIIGDRPQDVVPIKAMLFAAGLLEGGVVS